MSSAQSRDRVDRCPECGGRIREATFDQFCEDCGFLVAAEAIDRGPERRTGDAESSARRSGPQRERSRHDRGLSTKIGYGTGTEVRGSRHRQFVRMRRQHSRARFSSKAERNTAYGFTEIRRLKSALSLTEPVQNQACALFESAQSEDLLCGRTIEGFAAASIYAICRTQSIARTIEEITEVARATEDELKAAYDSMNRELGLPVGPISPIEYLPRYASELDLGADVAGRAREYASRLEEAGKIGGKNPSGVAGACLYLAATECGADVTQTDVADLASVSRMTIRSTVTDIESLPDHP